MVPYIADIKGRKSTYILNMSGLTLCYLGLVVSHNIYFSIVMFFFIGIFSGARVSVGTNYMNEFTPLKYQNHGQTAVNTLDSLTMVFEAIFYYFSRSWVPVQTVGLVGCALTVASLAILVPESPKYWYARRDFDKARKSLKRVGKFNGGKDKNIEELKFDVEVLDQNEEETLIERKGSHQSIESLNR